NQSQQFALRGRLQAEIYRARERVVAAPHVLQIDDKGVEAGELFLGGAEASESVAVKAVDAHPQVRIVVAADADQVLGFAQQSMFRAEQGGQMDAGGGGEEVARMAEFGIDGGGVSDEPDSQPAQWRE